MEKEENGTELAAFLPEQLYSELDSIPDEERSYEIKQLHKLLESLQTLVTSLSTFSEEVQSMRFQEVFFPLIQFLVAGYQALIMLPPINGMAIDMCAEKITSNGLTAPFLHGDPSGPSGLTIGLPTIAEAVADTAYELLAICGAALASYITYLNYPQVPGAMASSDDAALAFADLALRSLVHLGENASIKEELQQIGWPFSTDGLAGLMHAVRAEVAGCMAGAAMLLEDMQRLQMCITVQTSAQRSMAKAVPKVPTAFIALARSALLSQAPRPALLYAQRGLELSTQHGTRLAAASLAMLRATALSLGGGEGGKFDPEEVLNVLGEEGAKRDWDAAISSLPEPVQNWVVPGPEWGWAKEVEQKILEVPAEERQGSMSALGIVVVSKPPDSLPMGAFALKTERQKAADESA